MKTTKLWILREAKSIKYWLPNCLVFDSRKELNQYCTKWLVKSAEIYLDETLMNKF